MADAQSKVNMTMQLSPEEQYQLMQMMNGGGGMGMGGMPSMGVAMPGRGMPPMGDPSMMGGGYGPSMGGYDPSMFSDQQPGQDQDWLSMLMQMIAPLALFSLGPSLGGVAGKGLMAGARAGAPLMRKAMPQFSLGSQLGRIPRFGPQMQQGFRQNFPM